MQPKVFLPNLANEEAGIAKIRNNNLLPGTDSFTSSPKDVVTNTFSFLRVQLSILMDEKSLQLVGLKPATFQFAGQHFKQ